MTPLGRVALLSLERWDDVWRRNQHLASRLPALGLADHLTFVNPASSEGGSPYSPVPGVTVLSPRRRIPKRLGGLRAVAKSLDRILLGACETVWINDANTGALLSNHPQMVYDVTDDWRHSVLDRRERERLVAAEDVLAGRATTVVCSEELKRRWQKRYSVTPAVIGNGVDRQAIRLAHPRKLVGTGPHVGYVGTLHDERLNVRLSLATADAVPDGHIHLVGPDCLSPEARALLSSHPRVHFHGRVPTTEVPSWLVTFDVLISPHVVSDFTMSLDAIKAYEYLATEKPIVATPTSGFQNRSDTGLCVTSSDFPEAVRTAAARHERFRRSVPDWDDRAREFAAAITGTAADG